MKRIMVVFFAMLFVVIIGSMASAETINTYVGVITVTPGTAPYDPGNVGTWVNVSDLSGAGVGYGTSYPLPIPPAPTPAVAGSTLDHYWVQSATNELIYLLNTAASAVIGFPGNDHGPLPMENMEYKMWGSNDMITWTVGTLTAIYHDGWDATNPNNVQDWYATRWDFSQDYLYFKTVGTPGVVVGWGDYDPEMDGIAAVASSVPEPASMLLLGFGLIGLAGFRNRFKR
ncbi:MAG TPA: hypothetical protein DDX85_05560 [Nitrospiraceae bacterium]|nr:hypothetical protein [Nitrospiraceae bacterium]